ncbi:MAG: hypothetical protein AAAB35_10280 [Phyllobacterium sp.]|uniref:hypothetical protein n=1 Tax=Phyllobacterium sp. TaxID=1871046 RepID=UPI0030F32D70
MEASTQAIAAHPKSVSLKRIFQCVIGFAAFSVVLAVAGRHVGRHVALGGHTEDATLHEIIIGNDVLELPANMIRFESQRRNGVAERVDLYLHWPDMQGYQPSSMEDFNGSKGAERLIFASFGPRMDSRDMSGRYGPVYSVLTSGPGRQGPNGITIQQFRQDSGLANEDLAVSPERPGTKPFVARCLDAESSKGSLAACQRDIFVGEDLQLTYRFPRELLADWQSVEARMQAFARDHIMRAE